MFKIGEFSKLTQVTIRMLRYYDETGLLKPAKIDSWSGYRLYSVDQIPILNKIIYLRDSGFNVAEIADVINSDMSSEHIIELLNKKCTQIKKQICEEQSKLEKINIAKKELISGKTDLHCQVSIKSVPSFQVLSLRKIIPNYYAEGLLWHELCDFAKKNNIETSFNTFSIYHDEDYRETNVDVELCVPVGKFGQNQNGFNFRNTQEVSIMACTMVYGEFSNIANAFFEFAKWLSGNSKYKMSVPSRQIVHRGPWNEDNPEKYLTEIQIPLIECHVY